MSTRHFLWDRLDTLMARHKRAAEDALPKEATMAYYMEEADKASKVRVVYSIGINTGIFGLSLAGHYLLGFDLVDSLVAGLIAICTSSLLVDKFWRRKKIQEVAQASVNKRDQAMQELYTVRRYNWSAGLTLDAARRIGLFMDYCLLYAFVVENKPMPKADFEYVTGTTNYHEMMRHIDAQVGVNRVDAIQALLKDMQGRIMEVHRIANLDERAMVPAFWSIREAQPFWDIFEKMVVSIIEKIHQLSWYNNTNDVAQEAVAELPILKAVAISDAETIQNEIHALAEIVEPLFSKPGPIILNHKSTEAKFEKARAEIEKLAA